MGTDDLVRDSRGVYAWKSDDPLTEAPQKELRRVRALGIETASPAVLRGVEACGKLGTLFVEAEGGIDLTPLDGLRKLDWLNLEVGGQLDGARALGSLAKLDMLVLAMPGAQLGRLVETFDFAALGGLAILALRPTDGVAPLIDVRRFQGMRKLERLNVGRAVLGPRDVDAHEFAQMLPRPLDTLVCGHASDADVERIEGAARERGLLGTDDGFFAWERVVIGEPPPADSGPLAAWFHGEETASVTVDLTAIDPRPDAETARRMASRLRRRVAGAPGDVTVSIDVADDEIVVSAPSPNITLHARITSELRPIIAELGPGGA